MTGYGTGARDNGKVKYTVEIKSLNAKFLELALRLPKAVSDREFQIRSEAGKRIERGKASLTVTVDYIDQTARASGINAALLEKYHRQLSEIADRLGEPQAPLFALALNMPEVVASNEETVGEEEGKLLMEAFHEAADRFDGFRQDEGNVLRKDLESRVGLILDGLSEVEKADGSRIPMIRERLASYLDGAVGRENVDMNRFEQEIVYYIDKLDITEEKVRLRSHCDYFVRALAAPDSNGKKLGFISQEMGREINTLGAKANDAGIQQVVVRMKEELEKIKEQLLNVL